MADQLRTDFLDDILSEEMNQKRRYRVIQNDDGTISLEDATTYTQEGDNYGAQQINEERSAINDRLPLSGGTLTGDLTIHKNDPYLLLKNSGGGDEQIGLHYFGSSAGKNTFGVYDSKNKVQLMSISQETKLAKFLGSVQSLGSNNYGSVFGGSKARIFTDNEGGNFELYSADGSVRWQMDAYNNNLFRLFSTKDGEILGSFNFNNDGTVSGSYIKNSLGVTEAGYVLDARQGVELNKRIVTLKSSLSPKSIAHVQNVTTGTVINFTSSAKLLLVTASNASCLDTKIIPNSTNFGPTISSLVWSPSTLSRVSYTRTTNGLKIDTTYSAGEWENYGITITVNEIGY